MTIYAKASIVVILGVVVAIVAATTRHLGGSKHADARPELPADVTAATLEQIQTDLARLNQTVKNQRVRTQGASEHVVAVERPKDAQEEDGDNTPRRTFEERKAAEYERAKKREQSLVTALRLQQRDEVWASETEHAIQSRVSELDPQIFKTTAIRSVTCRQSICEARISHESKDEASVIAESMTRIPSISSLFSMREDGPVAGSYETAIFFGKKGHRLPH